MGSGASFDSGLGSIENEDHYFCHSCHRVFGVGSLEQPNEFLCPYCSSTFLEQMGRNERNFDVISLRHRTQGQLTLDQARRIANATAMLRLLETQLREELESLQQAFEAASFPAENRNRKGKLTKVMKGRLRNSLLSLDVICNQPSCPICSEDYVVGMEALKLPCSHVFHRDCVMPWLEQKQNCPICRAELSNVVPSIEELDCYSLEEIDERLRDLNVEVLDITTKEKSVMVALLHRHLTEQHAKEIHDNEQDNRRPILNVTFRTFTPILHNRHMSISNHPNVIGISNTELDNHASIEEAEPDLD